MQAPAGPRRAAIDLAVLLDELAADGYFAAGEEN